MYAYVVLVLSFPLPFFEFISVFIVSILFCFQSSYPDPLIMWCSIFSQDGNIFHIQVPFTIITFMYVNIFILKIICALFQISCFGSNHYFTLGLPVGEIYVKFTWQREKGKITQVSVSKNHKLLITKSPYLFYSTSSYQGLVRCFYKIY